MEDLAAVWALVDAERDRLGVWMPWVATTTSIDDQRAWFDRVLGKSRDPGRLRDLGRRPLRRGRRAFVLTRSASRGELGYWVGRDFEGRGLVTRACRALIDHGFGLGLHRLFIRAGVENARSRAVAERLGFTFEGVHRGEGRGTGGFYDLAVYGLLEDDWQKV